jgi:hypothetical protein
MIELLPGDIVFVIHKDNWISKAIAWFMKSRWSHSLMIAEQTGARTYTVETSDFQVIHGDFSIYEKSPFVEYEIYRPQKIGTDVREKMVRLSSEKLLEVYGYSQLISFGIRRILMRLGIKIHNFFRQGVVCNGVVLYGARALPYPSFNGIDPESIDTEEMYQLVINEKLSSGLPAFIKVGEKNGS